MPTSKCPECHEEVYVDAESEQGDNVTCEECGARLTVAGLDPIELDLNAEEEVPDYDSDRDYNNDSYDENY